MIFVTRPSPEGEQLTQLLNQANLPAKHLPFFKILPGRDLLNLQEQLTKLRPHDMVIVVSPQVSYAIKTYLCRLNLPTNVRYFAIGKKSADLFNQMTTVNVNYPAQENSEGLLIRLQSEVIENHTVLLLCGNVGRQLLAQELIGRNAKVIPIECYCREPIIYPTDILSHNIAEQTIIITSLEHLNQLELYSNLEHKQLTHLIVTSHRIFTVAKQHLWQNVLLVNGANNQNILNAAMQNFPNSNKNGSSHISYQHDEK
ncbi:MULTISPECIES: uroporphyrinogen-III synthase [unclassified Gilliamella]|uniref:uroporphyrinogen-III synthase n=1 Tax=unclassified Gilliamella TaxID=2685620 RepID=UPI00226AF990|nr:MULTISPECIES: uroporphyrinogen-III synthase [unclassified Gilliamella]MCX8642374.1 uroporphyrinogen-III synthase [Gilliamella sp. B3835]MCX8707772.1 uroporphyrinogen-III synthase [Gilliamella sp. B3783]MCX8709345.1 uroporphyrinogen-III synthase [Gilliamella sp. B3780]MCX8715231.1 uroporphyrinogen-III synthase [Gilliamella sp. B3781]MCX8716755.1 uroporphyrinogen-III synthase [Gilliamella sp. B3784]